MSPTIVLRAVAVAAVVLLAACTKPDAPDPERPPEPQAAAGVGESIQAPIEKARGVEEELQKAADVQRAAIEAAGG